LLSTFFNIKFNSFSITPRVVLFFINVKQVKVSVIKNFKVLNLNFGPQHPAAHGVLRIILEVKGEIIKKMDIHLGLLHRGTEKLLEYKTFLQGLPYFDRLDYVSMLTQEHSFCFAIESLQKVSIPVRAKLIRVIFTEITRLLNHIMNLTTHALDVGAMTPFLWGFEEREKLFYFYEKVSGARMHAAYFRPGGVALDLPKNILLELFNFCTQYVGRLDEYDELLSGNRIWLQRLKSVGVLSRYTVIEWALTGPFARASALSFDLRKSIPYEIYNFINFKVPLGTRGDSYDRFLIRLSEMRQSLYIILQSINLLEEGPVNAFDLKTSFDKQSFKYDMEKLILHFKRFGQGVQIAGGSRYSSVESPKGEFGVMLHSVGETKPFRCKIRSPGFYNLQVVPQLGSNLLISDLVTLIGTLDIVLGEIDR